MHAGVLVVSSTRSELYQFCRRQRRPPTSASRAAMYENVRIDGGDLLNEKGATYIECDLLASGKGYI